MPVLSVFRVVRAARGAPLWNPAKRGPGLGLKEVPGRALSFRSCGGRIQVAETKSKSQIWGQQESVG